jgi:acyl dehydratase
LSELGDLSELIGRSAAFNAARDEVNVPMIRRWCDVMGVENPVHTDAEYAGRLVFGGIVAPMAMLDVWDKPGIIFERDEDNPQGAALSLLDKAGFTSTVAVNSDLEQTRYLRPGEWVHSTLTLEDVSPEKQTGLGTGHFVTSRIRYLVGDEVVGSVLFRVLKFAPGTGRPASGGDGRSTDAVTAGEEWQYRTTTRSAGDVSAEQPLPSLAIPVTATLIIGGALMTLDYFDGHHDRDMAVKRGSKDIFMNIHTALGLVERYVGGWAGPEAIWRKITARLGASNYPGDTMTMSGAVTDADQSTGLLTVAYRGMNALGPHITGTVELVLPGGSAYAV